nr:DUF11 domain-containing protein [Naumannella cuiyingiana]
MPSGGAAGVAAVCTFTNEAQITAVTLDKQAAAPSSNTAGGTIAYTFVVRNTGTVPLDTISVSDPKVGSVSCPPGPLAVGATVNCTASYTLTQGDVNAGGVTNTATVTGTAANLPNATANDSVTTPIAAAPAIDLEKTGEATGSGPDGQILPGDPVRYRFTVRNTGNLVLTDIAITDPKIGSVTCANTTLAPGASTECQADAAYVLTPSDLDAGEVNNTATVRANSLGGAVTDTDEATVPLPAAPALELTKTNDVPAGQQVSVGQVINYTFTVRNTGNVSIGDLAVTDPKAGAVTCQQTSLAIGAETSCTASYTVSQADVDAGAVINNASATGTPARGELTDPTARNEVPTVDAAPGIGLEKIASREGKAPNDPLVVGDVISYSFVVTNTGNVTLTEVAVTDPQIAGITCPAPLAPGASVVCETDQTYTVTQTDVDAGEKSNTATATGTPIRGDEVDATDTATTPSEPAPAIALQKTSNVAEGDKVAAGDQITYSFLVTNVGNVTLANVGVTDTMLGGPLECAPTTLAPAGTATCEASYTVTQADVDAGSIVNNAEAAGVSPGNVRVTAPDTLTIDTVDEEPSIGLTKTADVGDERVRVGQVVTYTLVARNTGNVTLSEVSITDDLLGALTCDDTSTLGPDDTFTCTGTHTVTQADVDAGSIVNNATATGTSPAGAKPTADDQVTVNTVEEDPSIGLSKTSDVPADGRVAVGDVITYSFAVTNTGNVTLRDVAVTDDLITGPVTCDPTTLAPTETSNCTATYTVTQADVDAGSIVNNATATGTSPAGAKPTADDQVTVNTVEEDPSIGLSKTSDVPADGRVAVGDVITYSFAVTNTGNVTLRDVAVTDDLITGPVTCDPTTLAPTETSNCTATYTVTQADVDAGSIVNNATATGTSPAGAKPTADDQVTVNTVEEDPSIGLTKTSDVGDDKVEVGQQVTYTLVATNTGNVTLSGVSITDSRLETLDCPDAATVAPNGTFTCTGTYTVTQADVDAGEIVNDATTSGTSPAGTAVEAPAQAVVDTVEEDPSIGLTKTSDVGDDKVEVGQQVTYTLVATNTGNVTLSGVSITDSRLETLDCPDAATVAPNGTFTCTGTYTVTQADVDAGEIVNDATTSGTSPAGTAVEAPAQAVVDTVDEDPSIELTKTSDVPADGTYQVGQQITYSFVATNTGNVTLSDVGVTDPMLGGALTCTPTTLAPGEESTCRATYTVTQADFDAGEIVNTATAQGTSPAGEQPTDDAGVTVNAGSGEPAIELDKIASRDGKQPDDPLVVGDVIAYTFVITNTGNVTLNSLAVDDPQIDNITCDPTSIAPGGIATCTTDVTHEVTQADVDAGVVTNTATASGTGARGGDVEDSDDTTTPADQQPSLVMVKTSDIADGDTVAVDQVINYTFTITNTGNVTLTDLAVDDPKVGAVTCDPTLVGPGASVACTASYTVTQADVDAGVVANTAEASGIAPDGSSVGDDDSLDVPTDPAVPAIAVDKQAAIGDQQTVSAGDPIDYTFVITNTGNVTLSDVTIDDPRLTEITCDPAADRVLAPNETLTCTGTYVVSQADVDAGTIENTVTVSGTDPSGDEPPPGTDTTEVPADPAEPGLAVVKTSDVADGDTVAAGDQVTYTFTVTNTGNVTLTDVALTDPLIADLVCTAPSLAPTDPPLTCTGSYTVTPADVDRGQIDNTATASGQPPSGDRIEGSGSATVPTDPAAPAVTLDKFSDVPQGTQVAVGDQITYTFRVTNTGNVTLTQYAVTDPKIGDVTCPGGPIAAGAFADCTATYTVTQADVDAGNVVNAASVTATGARGGSVDAQDDDTVPTQPAAPSIAIEKTAAHDGADVSLGEVIDYTMTVTNTGNVTLTGVVVSDPLIGALTCDADAIAPGESLTCTGSYTVQQSDVDAGAVINTASVSGQPPTGGPVTDDDTVQTPAEPADPAIALDKTGSFGPDAQLRAGDRIDYTFAVTNTGNVTLSGVTVDDPKVGGVECPAGPLGPGQSRTCVATGYVVTQADVDAGQVVNTATATGTAPDGRSVSARDDHTAGVADPAPGIALDKIASRDGKSPDDPLAVGDEIAYTFVVTNTGNVTLDPVAVTDPLVGAVTCPDGALAPERSVTCTADATYTVTQADVDAGVRENTASATGQPPTGDPVSAEDSTTTPADQQPGLAMVKSNNVADGDTVGLGQVIDYTFTLTNTGNVTLDRLAVADAKVGAVTCPPEPLAPGAAADCTASYTVTQADVDAGRVVNDAVASGVPPSGTPVEARDSNQVPTVPADAALVLDKQALLPPGATVAAGDQVAYRFLITNAGNVTLTEVTVDDPLLGSVTCPEGPLAPGQTIECTADASHTVSQAEVDAGQVDNTATATGRPPSGEPPTATDTTSIPATPAAPAIALEKLSGVAEGATVAAGDEIDYTFRVTNTGNVTLSDIAIDDPLVGKVTCPPEPLAPGASTDCAADEAYAVTQADVDAGRIVNTATVSGTPPSGEPVTASDDNVVPTSPAAPAATLEKLSSVPAGETVAAGDRIDYTFRVTNTGNVTLTGVAITDPKIGAVSCPPAPLAPGEVTECTGTYAATQADADAGQVLNTATLTATGPNGEPVTATDDNVVPTDPRVPGLTTTKVAARTGSPDSPMTVGESIGFSVIVTNTGNVTLEGVVVADSMVGDMTCPRTTLEPGDVVSCVGNRTYTVTQADVDRGVLTNVATTTAVPVGGGEPLTSTATTTTPSEPRPAIALQKLSDLPAGETLSVGQPVRYSFRVINTGNVTLDPVAVTDPKIGAVNCPAGALAPGAEIECAAADAYVVTATEAAEGKVTNTAEATGRPTVGDDPVRASDDLVLPATVPAAQLTLIKASDVPAGDTVRAGQPVRYRFTVTNTGNVPVRDLRISDPKIGSVTCPSDPLAPGAEASCTADRAYTVTQAEVDAGGVDNVAGVTGIDPGGNPVTARDELAIPAEQAAPALDVVKEGSLVDPDGDGYAEIGDHVRFVIRVTNVGNVTIDDIAADDPLVGKLRCSADSLAPGASLTCEPETGYVASAADLGRGEVVNRVAVTGEPVRGGDPGPDGRPIVTGEDTVTVPLPAEVEPGEPPVGRPPLGRTGGEDLSALLAGLASMAAGAWLIRRGRRD